MKKFLKCLFVLATVGTAIGLIIAYFCKGGCSVDDPEEQNDSGLTEEEDFDLDVDLKPVSDREYVSLHKDSSDSEETVSDTEKEN